MNLFDQLRDKAVAVVTHNMGYTATWIPADHSDTQTAEVLYKTPNESLKELGRHDELKYYDYQIDYNKKFFVGLKESVDTGTSEVITIALPEGNKNFHVENIDATHDGNTLIAYLTLKKT